VAAVLLLLILASACNGAPTPVATTVSNPSPEATTGSETAEPQFPDFDPNNFGSSTVIDNEWMPMQPGTQWVYEGTAVEDGKSISRRIEFTVTDLTKEIEGVRTVVGWIVDYADGELVEKEIAFYAQDNDGNVWYLGEHPEDYEDGKFVASPTWIAGLEDARPGIKMMAEPQFGMPIYYQGWGPAVGWSDYGQVDQMGQETCVPVDCYKDVLVNAESSLGETGAFQIKYYARGVGEVRVGWKGEDETQEELELVELEHLSPEALAEVRAMALEVEKHAYEVSDVYKQTSPVEYPVGTPAIAITPAVAAPTQVSPPEGSASEVIVYASDLPQSALSEFEVWDDPASPGGKMIGIPNTGDELDPPPENDPHVTFKVQVQSGVPYRCWIHMKVGAPKGKSQANMLWVQFSDAVDQANQEAFKPGTGSYLTAEGPTQEGWTWVECDVADSEAEPLVYFRTSGEVTVRLQAGMEGVGFDQFLLSSARFLDEPPSEAVVEK
jgi:hypothetical protein